MNTFAKRLHYYREKANLTKTQLATKMGMLRQTYQKYESGERNPKADTLKVFADALQIPVSHLEYSEVDVELSRLNRYIRDAALGDYFSLDMFFEDQCGNVYDAMYEFFYDYKQLFEDCYPDFYKKYLEFPNFDSMCELYGHYRQCVRYFGTHREYGRYSFDTSEYNEFEWYKLAFCIGVTEYFEHADMNSILRDVFSILYIDESEDAPEEESLNEPEMPSEESADVRDGNNLTDEQHEELGKATHYFALALFIPYLSFITDALAVVEEFGTIDDFGEAFMEGQVDEQKSTHNENDQSVEES